MSGSANGPKINNMKEWQIRTKKTRNEFYALLSGNHKRFSAEFKEQHGDFNKINTFLDQIAKIDSTGCELKALENNLLKRGLPAHVRLLLLSRAHDECEAPATPTDNGDSVPPQVWTSIKGSDKKVQLQLEEWCANVPDYMASLCEKVRKNEIDPIYSGFSRKAKYQIKKEKNMLSELLEEHMTANFTVWAHRECPETTADFNDYLPYLEECVDDFLAGI